MPGGRKRNKSSPQQNSDKKKQKQKHLKPGNQRTDYDSDTSVYFETIEDSDSELSQAFCLPKMAAKFSKDDLRDLANFLAKEFRSVFLSELKSETNLTNDEETVQLKHEIQVLREENINLKAENAKLKASLSSSKLELDELEQYGRRMCLDISGIPDDPGTSSENVELKFLNIAKVAKIELSSTDIDRIHRKGKPKEGENRKVIVKFTNSKARDRVYSGRKQLSAGIFVQENLTNFRERLSFEARQLVREKLAQKTWIAGCKVYVSCAGEEEGSSRKIVIRDLETIQNIREGKVMT
jgi:hypothetical protein